MTESGSSGPFTSQRLARGVWGVATVVFIALLAEGSAWGTGDLDRDWWTGPFMLVAGIGVVPFVNWTTRRREALQLAGFMSYLAAHPGAAPVSPSGRIVDLNRALASTGTAYTAGLTAFIGADGVDYVIPSAQDAPVASFPWSSLTGYRTRTRVTAFGFVLYTITLGALIDGTPLSLGFSAVDPAVGNRACAVLARHVPNRD